MDDTQETQLLKTHFHGGEDREFRISSRGEILSILRGIAMRGTQVGIHYNDDQDSIVTRAIGIAEEGMWLDASWFLQNDIPSLMDGGGTFVSLHQHVKIQFDFGLIMRTPFRGKDALFLEWPEHLLRIQRREFFRSPVPPSNKASCIIPLPLESQDGPTTVRATHLLDISGGGLKLQCDGNDTVLQPDMTFTDCQLSLPDAEPMTVTLEVRNSHSITTQGNQTYKRVGCRFVDLGNHADNLLQRHITRLQAENISKRREIV